MSKRIIHNVTLTEDGAPLSTTTAFANNSGVDKGKGLLREIARATREPFEMVTGSGSFDRVNGSYSVWQGGYTGRQIVLTVKPETAAL